jgi:predicted nucleic acid-binding protein
VDEIAVINASPLIFLSRGGHMAFLQYVARRILVPQPVAEELLQRGESDVTVRAIRQEPRIVIAPVPPVPAAIEQWGLGPGESAVLAVAHAKSGAIAILDDLAGRKCATALGIPVRGTLGIVLTAKQHGVIPLARPVMEDLLRGGMYLSRSVLEAVLRRVGE